MTIITGPTFWLLLLLTGFSEPFGNADAVVMTSEPQVADSPSDDSAEASAPHRLTIEKARQVLKISQIAADNGLQDLSLRAFREALQGGPPLPEQPSPRDAFAISSGQVRLPNWSFRSRPMRPADPAQEQQAVVDEIEETIHQLDQCWQQNDFDPVAVYDTLSAVVFAETADRNANLFRRTVTDPLGDPASFSRNLGTRLIRWSVTARRSRELADTLEEITKADASFNFRLLRLEFALQQDNPENVRKALELCASAVDSVVDSTLIQYAGLLAVQAAGRPETFRDSLPLLEAAITDAERIRPRRGTDRADASLLLLLARFHFEAGEIDQGNAVIKRYLSAGEEMSGDVNLPRLPASRQQKSYAAHVSKRRREHVAELLFRTGYTVDAVRQLVVANTISTAYESSTNDSTVLDLLLISALQDEAPETRYELLTQLCLPDSDPAVCHFPTAILPSERPPAEFRLRKADTNRPSDESDPLFNDDIISTASLLVDTAAEIGRLDELRIRLETLHQQDARNAIQVLAICLCRSGESAEATRVLDTMTEQLIAAGKNSDDPRNPELSYVTAIEALHQPATFDAGVRLLNAGYRQVQATGRSDLIALYRRGLLKAKTLFADSTTGRLTRDAEPLLWSPSSTAISKSKPFLTLAPVWLAHENVIHHLTGSGDDALYFRWPLTGEFEFTVEAWDSTGSESDLGYGGLSVESHRHINRVRANSIGRDVSIYRNGTFNAADAYQLRTVRVSAEEIVHLVNGHPVHRDAQVNNSSPWLMLFCTQASSSYWRNPRMSGSPNIPREVLLSGDPALRGWTALLQHRSRTDPLVESTQTVPLQAQDADWLWVDGQIVGQFRIGSSDAQVASMLRSPSQSLLQYNRPLMSGETVSWEFQYQSGTAGVSPALGRLVFLLKPEGVRLHWAAPNVSKWTMLETDNEVELPLGTDALSLKDGWNLAALTLNGNTVQISLNGSPIADYQLESNASRRFGFFHYPGHTEARARNVSLTGDWPDSLTDQHLSQLTATLKTELSPDAATALHELFGEQPFAANPMHEMWRFAGLPLDQRYAALLRHVLPKSGVSNYRFTGDITPSDPPPANNPFASLASSDTADGQPLSAGRRMDSGGQLVSPAVMLVETAAALERLDELKTLIESRPGHHALDELCRLGLLALIDLERDDLTSAARLLKQLDQHSQTLPGQMDQPRWVELVVAAEALTHGETRRMAALILDGLLNRMVRPGAISDGVWNQHVRALHSRAEWLEKTTSDAAARLAVTGWHPVRRVSAESRGLGLPFPVWMQSPDGTIRHLPGHLQDFLYFPAPIRGDFEFECELSGFGDEAAQVGYGNFIPELTESRDALRIVGIAHDIPDARLPEKLIGVEPWYHYRLVVQDGTQTIDINGEQVIQSPVPANRDPWLVIRCAGSSRGGIRAIRLTGDIDIPRELPLDVSSQLVSWSGDYFREVIRPPSRDWSRNSDWTVLSSVITGRRRPERHGMDDERLLQTHRPMLEDGVITYDFFYKPDEALVHPAMDRLAFLLDAKKGVRVHWVTNGHNNRSGLDADNITDEPEHQLVQSLPLLSNDWNRMEVRLSGDTVTLVLNDVDIFNRKLEDTNQRFFGLFHYQDRTTARIRDVIWKGDWPTTVPDWIQR